MCFEMWCAFELYARLTYAKLDFSLCVGAYVNICVRNMVHMYNSHACV
jgi:hypothetical protein